MSAKLQMDRVWFWRGGRERGAWEWCESSDHRATMNRLERMGYIAALGSSKIGAPEGRPSKERFDALDIYTTFLKGEALRS